MFNVLTTKRYNSIVRLLKEWFILDKVHIRNILPVIICWFLWSSMNESKHEEIKMNALSVISKVKNKIQQLFVANLLKYDFFKGFFMCLVSFVWFLVLILPVVQIGLFIKGSLFRDVPNLILMALRII